MTDYFTANEAAKPIVQTCPVKIRRYNTCAYYSNSTASFHPLLIGDLVFKLNPGPLRNKIRVICSLRGVHKRKALSSRGTSTNLICIKPEKTQQRTYIKFAVGNANSVNKKSASICDFVISMHIDILVITETWLNGDLHGNNTIAEILNTLKDFDFRNVPRVNRAGGGAGVLLRKGFKVSRKYCSDFSSMEYMDLAISSSNSTIRLVTICRPPSSKKNRATPATFIREFSSLLEHVLVSWLSDASW